MKLFPCHKFIYFCDVVSSLLQVLCCRGFSDLCSVKFLSLFCFTARDAFQRQRICGPVNIADAFLRCVDGPRFGVCPDTAYFYSV